MSTSVDLAFKGTIYVIHIDNFMNCIGEYVENYPGSDETIADVLVDMAIDAGCTKLRNASQKLFDENLTSIFSQYGISEAEFLNDMPVEEAYNTLLGNGCNLGLLLLQFAPMWPNENWWGIDRITV